MNRQALLIIDMSVDFVADNGGLTVGKPAQDIVEYILETAEDFLQRDQIVVVTMDAHEPADEHFALWPVHNVVGTEGQKLFGKLQDWYVKRSDHSNVMYVPKTNYNAFFKTDLAEMLREQHVDKVHAVGVCTDICDFLTVAGADAEGFKTAVHRRGVATFTPNGELFLNHMTACFHTELIG